MANTACSDETAPVRSNYSKEINDTIDLTRKYAPQIAHHIRENALRTTDQNMRDTALVQDRGMKTSSNERHKVLHQQQQAKRVLGKEGPEVYDEDNGSDVHFRVVQDFLLTTPPFKRLVAAMRRDLYCDDQLQMRQIEAIVTKSLFATRSNHDTCPNCFDGTIEGEPTGFHRCNCRPTEMYHTSYSIEWDPVGFVNSQYDDSKTPLGNVLVLSGSGLYAYASSCTDYIRHFWPNSCNILLPLL